MPESHHIQLCWGLLAVYYFVKHQEDVRRATIARHRRIERQRRYAKEKKRKELENLSLS